MVDGGRPHGGASVERLEAPMGNMWLHRGHHIKIPATLMWPTLIKYYSSSVLTTMQHFKYNTYNTHSPSMLLALFLLSLLLLLLSLFEKP
ncbi:hypothetical protein RIF29_10673 [Crotalaria pallida]|uniref:Uncharacterized protein n=1 Tax=Crotalaria pallida TaxID=3830 RepID=A0AAN9FSY9_CROPI